MIEFDRIITTLATVMAMQVTAATDPPTTTGNTVTPACDSTGATDVTACLNTFFAGLPDGTDVTLAPGGRYRAEDTVTLSDQARITIDGNGATLTDTTTGQRGPSLALTQVTDVSVTGLKIIGANAHAGPDGPYEPSLEGQHGVRILGGSRVRLTDVSTTDTWGDGLYVGRTLSRQTRTGVPRTSSDVTLDGVQVSGTGRQGISITAGSRIAVENSSILGARRSVIDMEPNEFAIGAMYPIEDVTIAGNTVSPGRFNFVAMGGGGVVRRVAITGNRGLDKSLSVVILNNSRRADARTDIIISGNRSDRPYGSLLGGVVVAKGAQRVSYTDNVQPIQPRRALVGLLGKTNDNGIAASGLAASGNNLSGRPQRAGGVVARSGSTTPAKPAAVVLPRSA